MAFSIRLYPNTPKFRTVGINKIGEEVLKKHRDGEKYCPSTIGRSLVKQTLTPFLYSKNIDLKTKINFMTKFNDGINSFFSDLLQELHKPQTTQPANP